MTLLGRYTGATAHGGHTYEMSGEVDPREFGISHLMIRKSVTVNVQAELLPADV